MKIQLKKEKPNVVFLSKIILQKKKERMKKEKRKETLWQNF